MAKHSGFSSNLAAIKAECKTNQITQDRIQALPSSNMGIDHRLKGTAGCTVQ